MQTIGPHSRPTESESTFILSRSPGELYAHSTLKSPGLGMKCLSMYAEKAAFLRT